jgi:hypothetical protein
VRRSQPAKTDRLKFVLERLNKADKLEGELTWKTELWDSVTVEELLGALIKADGLIEHDEMQLHDS